MSLFYRWLDSCTDVSNITKPVTVVGDDGGGGSGEGRAQTQTLVIYLKSSAFLLVPNRAGAGGVSGPLLLEDLCLCPAQSRP